MHAMPIKTLLFNVCMILKHLQLLHLLDLVGGLLPQEGHQDPVHKLPFEHEIGALKRTRVACQTGVTLAGHGK